MTAPVSAPRLYFCGNFLINYHNGMRCTRELSPYRNAIGKSPGGRAPRDTIRIFTTPPRTIPLTESIIGKHFAIPRSRMDARCKKKKKKKETEFNAVSRSRRHTDRVRESMIPRFREATLPPWTSLEKSLNCENRAPSVALRHPP